jgi:hypothetical protein
MKERPILFSAPMVRAILAGTKTQTRRIVKPQPDTGTWKYVQPMHGRSPDGVKFGNWREWRVVGEDYPDCEKDSFFCPYGELGDRLWVKETWSMPGGCLRYRADCERANGDVWAWAPSIHMRRVHSRIILNITDVRVERLQDISYEDALAEGAMDAAAFCESGEIAKVTSEIGETAEDTARRLRWPQRDYEAIWTRINGPGSWDANPWVWVINFRRVEC